MYVIRHGMVGVMGGDEGGEPREVIRLGRGHVIGERVLIGSSMRTADCVARGDVTVLVLQKADILRVESPIFEWMLDYEILLR